MNKNLILLLVSSCLLAACSSTQPAIEIIPAEATATQVPTHEKTLPSTTAETTATVKPKLETTDTSKPTETPTESSVGESGGATNREVTETLVLEYDPNETNFIYMETSPDGYRLAYKKFTDQGQYVVLDEEEQGPYDEIEFLDFSPDSQHLVYVAILGDKKFVVLDGVEQTYYDDIYASARFSPDSQHIAYEAKQGKKSIAVIDSTEFIYDDIRRGIRFSPNGQHFAFVARNLNADNFVVLDGKVGEKYDDIEIYNLDLYFSPDSNHLAYLAKIGDEWFVVLDGEEGFPFSESSLHIVFSPDSYHLVYDAKIGDHKELIFDGEKMDKYDTSFSPHFSQDSQHFAYKASLNGDSFVVVDGIEGPTFDGYFISFTFSPDGQHHAYVIEINDQYAIVVDGEIQEGHDISSDITFSPDSSHLIFIAQDDESWVEYVVVDGIGGKKYDDIISPILFDSDESFHYMALQGEQVYLVEEVIK